jgi:hypothetical protein
VNFEIRRDRCSTVAVDDGLNDGEQMRRRGLASGNGDGVINTCLYTSTKGEKSSHPRYVVEKLYVRGIDISPCKRTVHAKLRKDWSW